MAKFLLISGLILVILLGVNLAVRPVTTPEGEMVPVPSITSGVRGLVTIGPTCPVIRLDEKGACADKPYAANFAISTAAGRLVRTVSSGADGRFASKLAPGSYVIHSVSSSATLPRISEQQFVVRPGRFTDVTIQFDSGIR